MLFWLFAALLTVALVLALALGISLLLRVERGWEGVGLPRPPRKNWLVEKYGPKLYSQNYEELIIRDHFNDQTNGVFVDVGASDYRVNSTTYYLEKHLNWRGLAVDALCDYRENYLIHRKKTQFFCFYVSNRSDQEVDFFINLENKRVSTGDPGLARRQGEFAQEKIPTITLDDLLNKTGLTHFDFLSMDIEFGEPAALEGFDIQRFKPDLVCIEFHKEVRGQILDYFSRNRYRRVEKYERLDPLNAYFAPVETPTSRLPGKEDQGYWGGKTL
jgi:FkbM family methyltransferase